MSPLSDKGCAVLVRSVHDLQAAARSRRRELHLTQQAVAESAGVSRKWLVGFERGSAGAVELALVLRVLGVLDLQLSVDVPDGGETEPVGTVDLTAHLAHLADLSFGSRSPEPGATP